MRKYHRKSRSSVKYPQQIPNIRCSNFRCSHLPMLPIFPKMTWQYRTHRISRPWSFQKDSRVEMDNLPPTVPMTFQSRSHPELQEFGNLFDRHARCCKPPKMLPSQKNRVTTSSKDVVNPQSATCDWTVYRIISCGGMWRMLPLVKNCHLLSPCELHHGIMVTTLRLGSAPGSSPKHQPSPQVYTVSTSINCLVQHAPTKGHYRSAASKLGTCMAHLRHWQGRVAVAAVLIPSGETMSNQTGRHCSCQLGSSHISIDDIPR